MRVGLLAPLVGPIGDVHLGGAQAVVADLARGLTAKGHEVVVYAARGSLIPGVALAPVDIDSTPLRADLVRPGVDGRSSSAMTAAYRQVYAHVRRERFDVVHNHGFDAAAVSVASAHGLAVLHTLHLPPTRSMAGAINDARRSGAAPVWCAGVSRAHARAWGEMVVMDGVLRNGVPVDEIDFVARAGTTAVVAARFSPEKGLDDGIAAAREGGRPVVVHGTPYDDVYERSVRQRWATDSGVSFAAPVARRDLWRALGSAGVVLCLSLWDEPFGMVAAEAQAAGTPVVASRAGGLVEVVRDGVTGFLVAPGNAAAAVAALARVAALSREACRLHAGQSLDLTQSLAAHEALYVRLAARN